MNEAEVGSKEGWIKLHIACDAANHVVASVEVMTEHEADSGKQFNEPVGDAWENVGEIAKIHGDTAYDSRSSFDVAARIGAQPVIKPRMNSTARSKGSCIGPQTVRDSLSDPELWEQRHRCGKRWLVEAVLSSLKRIVGQYFTLATDAAIFSETAAKVLSYNAWRRTGKAKVRYSLTLLIGKRGSGT